MRSSKQVLVVTTSNLGDIKIINYLKPVSAHVVAGTNVFSDFAASFTDLFGGRSGTYQRQLSSLYDEAIERIKIAAFELGANCVLGLKVDIDEISGKGKAMFMITAVGTAAIAENIHKPSLNIQPNIKSDTVSVEKINIQERKIQVISDASKEYWEISDELWDFITDNQIEEVYPALVKKHRGLIVSLQMDEAKSFYRKMVNYINNLPDDRKHELLYSSVFNEKDKQTGRNISTIIYELQMLDLKLIADKLLSNELDSQKRAMQMLLYDKPFYNREDLIDFDKLKDIINNTFRELGTKTTKKLLLSAKGKDVWICECGQSNDYDNIDDSYCSKCLNDIYGFKRDELSPNKAIKIIDNKIKLISQFII